MVGLLVLALVMIPGEVTVAGSEREGDTEELEAVLALLFHFKQIGLKNEHAGTSQSLVVQCK